MDKTTTLTAPTEPRTSPEPFRFERYGKSYHLEIKDVEDLKKILELDEAHWVATNAPIETINTDPVFLDLLDTDDDGRVRTEEVKQALTWLFDHLSDTRGVRPEHTTLDVNVIRRDDQEGKRIYNSAMKIIRRKGSPEPAQVTLEEVRQIKKEEAEGGKDTAGMVLPTAAPDETIRVFLEDIIATVGGEEHPSGALGVTADRLEQFLQDIRAHHAWLMQGELVDDQPSSAIMPFGKETPAIYTLFDRLQTKLDQYFALCGVARIAPTVTEQLRQHKLELQQADFPGAPIVNKFLAEAPLAEPTPDGVLNFEAASNPFYMEDLAEFRARLLPLIFDSPLSELSASQWKEVKARLQPYQTWIASKPQVRVESLSADKLHAYLDNTERVESLRGLIQESYKTAFVLDNLSLLEKLILYQAYLIPFVNSFVSFPHLYDPKSRALFEMGTLIMDGRHFTLSVKVPNREQHAKISSTSNMFVLYVEISSKEGEPLYEVAVPVTSGMRGNLQVNKRGIFRDVEKKERHAKIVHIVENPISFLEALSAPFNKLGKTVTAKLDEMSAKAQENLEAIGAKAVTSIGSLPKAGAAVQKGASTTTGGLLAGGGIAIAALSSSAAFITKTLSGLSWAEIIGGVLGALFAALLAVMLPTSIVAYLKLSKRDLSCILEGSGWGLNSRMRLTHKQAREFTLKPPYPLDAEGILPVHRRRWWIIGISLAAVVILIAILFLVIWFKSET